MLFACLPAVLVENGNSLSLSTPWPAVPAGVDFKSLAELMPSIWHLFRCLGISRLRLYAPRTRFAVLAKPFFLI